MTLTSLQALTWGTVTGAVVSALLLASGESGSTDLSWLRRVMLSPAPRSVDASSMQPGAGIVPASLQRVDTRSEPVRR
jgi:hypothetical protein